MTQYALISALLCSSIFIFGETEKAKISEIKEESSAKEKTDADKKEEKKDDKKEDSKKEDSKKEDSKKDDKKEDKEEKNTFFSDAKSDKVFAKIGTKEVTKADLDEFIQALPAEILKKVQENNELAEGVYANALRNIIMKTAILEKMKKDKFNPEDDKTFKSTVENAIAEIKIKKFLLSLALKKITDAELKTYYEEKIAKKSTEESKYAMILVDEKTAKDIESRLAKKDNFIDIAKEVNKELYEKVKEMYMSPGEGILGLSPDLSKAAEKLKKNEYTEKAIKITIKESDESDGKTQSVFVYKIDTRKRKNPDFKDVKEALKLQLAESLASGLGEGLLKQMAEKDILILNPQTNKLENLPTAPSTEDSKEKSKKDSEKESKKESEKESKKDSEKK
jgi:PPIC-type PPIASE domain